jgi:hypothetical protein
MTEDEMRQRTFSVLGQIKEETDSKVNLNQTIDSDKVSENIKNTTGIVKNLLEDSSNAVSSITYKLFNL